MWRIMAEQIGALRVGLCQYGCICGLVIFPFLPAFSMSVSFVRRDIYESRNHLNLERIGSQTYTSRSEMQRNLNKHKVSLLDGQESTEPIVFVNSSHQISWRSRGNR